MDKIRFANGVEYKCGFCGQPNAYILYIILDDVSYIEAATVFSNPENLTEITFIPASGESMTFTGYTVFEFLVNEPNGGKRASLRVPYATEA